MLIHKIYRRNRRLTEESGGKPRPGARKPIRDPIRGGISSATSDDARPSTAVLQLDILCFKTGTVLGSHLVDPVRRLHEEIILWVATYDLHQIWHRRAAEGESFLRHTAEQTGNMLDTGMLASYLRVTTGLKQLSLSLHHGAAIDEHFATTVNLPLWDPHNLTLFLTERSHFKEIYTVVRLAIANTHDQIYRWRCAPSNKVAAVLKQVCVFQSLPSRGLTTCRR